MFTGTFDLYDLTSRGWRTKHNTEFKSYKEVVFDFISFVILYIYFVHSTFVASVSKGKVKLNFYKSRMILLFFFNNNNHKDWLLFQKIGRYPYSIH